jgi:hypothetical protein
MQFCPSGPCFCLPVITSTSLPSTCRSSALMRSTSGLEIQLCKRQLKLFRDCYLKANCTYCLIALAAGCTFSSEWELKTDWPTAVKQKRDPVSYTDTACRNYGLVAVAKSTVIVSLRGVGELRRHDLLNVDCSDLNELYGLWSCPSCRRRLS